MNPEEFAPDTQQQQALNEALGNLAPRGKFTFYQYTKYQMSQDGYIFWVKSQETVSIKGALHMASDREQEIDDTIAMNSVILDSGSEITEFNQISPTTMWVGDLPVPDGSTVKVAFQRRGPYFQNAGIFHYAGFAVFPPFGPQLVDSETDLPTGPIVSNSLPLWLAFGTTGLPLYPSFLVPENLSPPYIAVHIDPDQTTQIQPVPYLEWTTANPDPQSGFYDLPVYQLMHDHVEMICYGLTNTQAWQFVYQLISKSYADQFGFMTTPVLKDDKRTQPEIMAIAMKKRLEFDAAYYMTTSDAAARRLIASATVSYTFQE